MAKKVSENDIQDMSQDWGMDSSNNLPYSGAAVQKFIKEKLNSKMGYFHYDATSNRYLCFADEASKDAYVANPTLTGLVLGAFDAPFNYEAVINLLTPSYNAVFLGSTGNYIDFTFDIKNKEGNSTGENVNVTYTFIRNASKKVVSEVRKFGESVRMNIDEYLLEGTNTVIVGIAGQTSLAANTAAVTYQVVNLQYSDNFNIAQVQDLSAGIREMEVFFKVSGYGTKTVEWFLDGQQLPFVKSEDEVVDVASDRTKYISIAGLAGGLHTLQSRAYTVINGEKFYTGTLYREFMVDNGSLTGNLVVMAAELPHAHGIVGADNPLVLYGAEQYIPYELRFAVRRTGEVSVSLDGLPLDKVNATAGAESFYQFTSTKTGTLSVKLSADGVTREVPVSVNKSSLGIAVIDTALLFDFRAAGRNNASVDRDVWSYGNYKGTFSGFNWNASSGWVDNALLVNSGASFAVDIAPLASDATAEGMTLEFEFSTSKVEDDNAVVCDLTSNGRGLLITASEARLTSAAGEVVSTRFKAGEVNRIAFVINRKAGVTYKGLAFIYVNGILSGAVNYGSADNFISAAQLSFHGTDGAQVELRSMRFYGSALSAENVLNNYILYRDSLDGMMEVYYRNEVYAEGTQTFSPEMMLRRLPVMILTGDIPTLEAATSTSTQILVDIDYANAQDPSKNFTMKNAALRIQGTSSLAYPRKNFRFYTRKEESTVVRDANGNEVADKLYSFKDGAQPVDCWCLKADFAESSGTHNTGIARIWNKAMTGAVIQHKNVLGKEVNGYALRTKAQVAALGAGYPYDVRTTIDGFPIVLFYRRSATDNDLIFLGKYNFNNDKSTPSVFGFENIPDFDNSRMQCWETRDNGHPLGLFTDVSGFDADWSEAFESRYPDTKTPDTADLKAFSVWMNGVSQSDFATQKWAHMDVYKVAAYYCYLMRFGAVDQPVKNAFLTSEDGEHFFFINYDNDTINGLINTGRLALGPDVNRETVGEDGEYVYAGHNSVLWNRCEADAEFMEIVSIVDNALYSAGLRYDEVIAMFNDDQADKWVERVYNQDAEYKYLLPYVSQATNNLFMLQGARSSHRSWWLSKRFSLYDSLFVSGNYKDRNISFKCLNDTQPGQVFSIKAGTAMNYGYGINNGLRETGIALPVDGSRSFTTTDTLNLGDVVKVFAAANLSEIDLSRMADRLAVLDCSAAADPSLGTKLKKLILGGAGKSNASLTAVSGINILSALQEINVEGFAGISSLDLTAQKDLRKVYAQGSGVASIDFAAGAPVEYLGIPSAMMALSFSQLPYLTLDNLVPESGYRNVHTISITGCPNLSNSFSLVKQWMEQKSTADASCTLVMDHVDWAGVDAADILSLGGIRTAGGTLSLKGVIRLNEVTLGQVAQIKAAYGESVFVKGGDLWMVAPESVFISGGSAEMIEGESLQFTADVLSEYPGQVAWSIQSGAGASISSSGLLTTTETGSARTVVIKVVHTPTQGAAISKTHSVAVKKAVRPTSATLSGSAIVVSDVEYSLALSPSGINRDYSVDWALSGSAFTNGHVVIKSSDKDSCIVKMVNAKGYGDLKVTATVTTDKGTKIVASKDVLVGTTLTVNIASNQGTDATIAAVKAEVKFGSTTLQVAGGTTVNVPVGESVSVTYPKVDGYTQPSVYTYTSTTSYDTASATYSTTIVSVTMSDNQTSLNDISGVKATVKYDSVSAQVTTGGTVKVPTGKSVTITWGAVSGYSTPATQTFTATGTSMQYEGVYKTTVLSLTVKTNQSSHTDVTSQNITVKGATVNTTIKNGGSVKIPFGEAVTLTAPAVNGYATPSAISYTAADVSTAFIMTYNTTIVKVVMADNQTAYNDISGATATVAASGMTTATVSSNGTVKVPTGASCTITWNAVTGYKTPDKQTFTTSGTSVTKTGTYQTEIVTVNVTSDIAMPSSYTITVSGIGSQTTASKVYKVPFGTSYTVSATAADGYKTPETQTFTASQASRTVSVVYLEKTIELPSISGVTDLSRMDVHGNTIQTTTANCYVVRTTGTYAFPLVFGNAFKDGAVNTAAYTNNGGANSHDFVDYNGNVITSPYIEDVSGEVSSVQLSISDEDGFISNLSLVNGTFGKYVKFTVSSTKFVGTNSIISVKDSNGVIMWSWHIWHWVDDLTPVEIENNTGVKYSIMPVHLASKWDDTSKTKIKNWFYQWGRPTPLLCPASYNSANNHASYGELSYSKSSSAAGTYQEGIRNPNMHYCTTVSPKNWFGKSSFYNLWDSKCTSTGNNDNNVVKTVYDPCPVGFKMPNGNTFTGFSKTNVVGNYDNGWYFKRNANDTTGIFFPTSLWRGVTTGDIYADNPILTSVWLSSSESQNNVYTLYYNSTVVNSNYSNPRAAGYSVRPVTDEAPKMPLENGVYIQAVDGTCYTESEWDGSKTPNGIAVVTDNCEFVMALQDASTSDCRWGGYGKTVSGIVTTTDKSTAQADYEGYSNTYTIITELYGYNDSYVNGAPAAEYCGFFMFPNGKYGYLGAAGEWQAALDNKTAITSALSKCGGTAMSKYYWTSAQYGSQYSWYSGWSFGSLSFDEKYNSYSVRAFTSI